MWTVIYFEALEPQRTRVRVVGFGDDDESKKMRAFFDRGNAATLLQLRKCFSQTARGRQQYRNAFRPLTTCVYDEDGEKIWCPG